MRNGWLKYIKAAYAAEPGEQASGPSIEQGRVVMEEEFHSNDGLLLVQKNQNLWQASWRIFTMNTHLQRHLSSAYNAYNW